MQSKTSPSVFFIGLILISLLVPLQSVQGQTRVLYEGFESEQAFTNRWTVESFFPGGPTWGVVDYGFGAEGAARGTNKIYCVGKGYYTGPLWNNQSSPYYPDNVSTFFETTVNFSNLLSARLSFWYKAKIWPGSDETGDEFSWDYLEVTVDGFPVWNSQDPLGELGTRINNWTPAKYDPHVASIDLTDFCDLENPFHTVRFEFSSDGASQENWDPEGPSTRDEGIYIDEVMIDGYTAYQSDFTMPRDGVVDLVWQTNNPANGSSYAAAWTLTNTILPQVSTLLTVTKPTESGMAFTVNGDKRTWTNKVASGAGGSQILISSTTGGTATNLYTHVSLHPFTGPTKVFRQPPNAVRLEGLVGQTMNVSASGTPRPQVSAIVTVKTATQNGMSLTVNGNKRTWTNKVSSAASQILTSPTPGGSATNLHNQIAAFPYNGPVQLIRHATNAVRLVGQVGQVMNVSAAGPALPQVTATVFVKNGTQNGMFLTVNGDKRTWTNHVVNSANQILTNRTAGGSATNLYNHVALRPFSGPVQLIRQSTNSIQLRGAVGQAMNVSAFGNWCTISYATNFVAGSNWCSVAYVTNFVAGPNDWCSIQSTTNFFGGFDFRTQTFLRDKIPVAEQGWEIVGQSDFNFDNDTDLLWKHKDGRLQAWLMTNGVYMKSIGLAPQAGPYRLAALADMDNNFCRDFIWENTNSGVLNVRHMFGTNWVRSSTIGTTNKPGYRVVMAEDFNRDGFKDLLVQHSGGSISFVYLGGLTNGIFPAITGTGSDYLAFTVGTSGASFSQGWKVVGGCDFDRDGNRDLLMHNTDGRVAIWYMELNKVRSQTLFNGGKPAPSNWKLAGPR